MMRLYSAIVILALISCRKQKEPQVPYFALDSVGQYLLSGLKMNDTLKFTGSNGSYREYNIFKIEKVKRVVQHCSWNSGRCEIYYYFDETQISFLRTDSIPLWPDSPLGYSMKVAMTLPLGIDEKNLPRDVRASAAVYGAAFIDYNGIPLAGSSSPSTNSTPYITYPSFYTTQSFLSYSNSVKTYTEVVIIKSGNNSLYKDYLGKSYTINEVWFDKKFGIVFFKDIYGNSWSRIN